MSNEIKVGLLLVFSLGVLALLSLASGTLGFGSKAPMRELFAVFTDVQGIKEGSTVKMAGVDVGSVTRVELQTNGTAILRFNVRESVALPVDVSAQITTSGLIGERYVALVPGVRGAAGDGGLLAENVTQLPVLETVDPTNISTDFAEMARDMKGMISRLNTVLGDPENGEKLQRVIDGLAKFSDGLGGTGGDLDKTMKDFSAAARNLAEISDNLKNGRGTLGQLLVEDPSGTNTKQNLNQTLEQLDGAVKEFRQIMQKINGGQGTLGKLVNDNETAEKFEEALDTFNDLSTTLDGFKAQANVEGVSLPGESGVFKGGVNGRLQLGTTFVDAGVTGDGFAMRNDSAGSRYYGKDFGSQTKFTAQVGKVFPGQLLGEDVAVRAGLKNNHAGLGADTYGSVPVVGSRVKYSADVYDFGGNDTPGTNKPHVDLTARADLVGRVYGVVGYDNVLSEDYGGPMVGLGVRFGTDATKKYVSGKSL